MKLYSAFLFCALASIGCIDVALDVDASTKPSPTSPITMVGPDVSADVPLGDADNWIVPPLNPGAPSPAAVVWTLIHPAEPKTVVVRRTCTDTIESFLWLSDPPDWNNGLALATMFQCGTPGEFFATVELAYDGTQWLGVSATGAAKLLPTE